MKQLNFSSNFIEIINFNTLSSLSVLTHLDLSFNEIQFIDKNLFENLKELSYLDLSHNKIKCEIFEQFKETKI